MKEMWDSRYGVDEYVYGTDPNNYFKSCIDKVSAGRLLLPAEGEGRNAVYAAKLGWEVEAFDLSEMGRQKALKLAEKSSVSVSYRLGSMDDLAYPKEQFDALALIYAHIASGQKRKLYHRRLAGSLKRGGVLILEGFSRRNLEMNDGKPAGGPKDPGMLFTRGEIQDDFPGFMIHELNEEEISLHEGLFHIGKASVIRLYASKI